MSVTNSVVVHFELVNTVDVWNFELSFVYSVRFFLEGRSYERIDSDKFQLNIGGIERLPVSINQFFDFDLVNLKKVTVSLNL